MSEQTAVAKKCCTKCGRSLPLDAFARRERENPRTRAHCRECQKASIDEWRRKNADYCRQYAKDKYNARSDAEKRAKRIADREAYRANPDKWRDSNLRQHYGITLAEYREMEQAQGGRCAICGGQQVDGKRDLAVDHHHGTGKVRGLLCGNCNRGIGMFADDPAVMARAITYLTETT